MQKKSVIKKWNAEINKWLLLQPKQDIAVKKVKEEGKKNQMETKKDNPDFSTTGEGLCHSR